MAKPGTPRHSKSARKPVTINLDPEDVKREDAAAAQTARPAEPVGDFSKNPEALKPQAAISSEKTATRPPFPSTAPSSSSSGTSSSTGATSAPVARGLGAMFLAGVAGGVIALAGAFALQWGNVIPSPGARVTAAELAKIEQEIARLHISPPPAPMDDAAKQQLAGVAKTAADAAAQAGQALSGLTALQERVENAPVAPAGNNVDVEAITERLNALEAKLASAQSQAEQNATTVNSDSNAVSDLQVKLNALQESVAETARQPDAAALIAANSLKTAVDRGGSFVAELDIYAPLAPQSSDIDALRPYASKGIPTIADLNAWFGPVADKIVATANKLPADAGVWDQLVASAKGLVNIRPVGDVSGSSVGPIAARMEAALQAGDLERAIGEWEQLPDDAKSVSQEFAGQMKARRDADALVTRLVTDSLKPKAATPAPVAN